MIASFLCNDVYTYGKTGWSPGDDFLAGTEESIVEWSKELANRGYKVRVYYNGVPGQWHGVDYLPLEEYRPEGVTINIKSSHLPPQEKTFYLTNEVNADQLNLADYEAVIFPSQWAKDNIPVNNRVEILPHGYDPKEIYPAKKVPKQVLYASSPDRGLETLLAVWPTVHNEHPDATLVVTYKSIYPRSLPGILFLGEVDKEMMNDLFRTSSVWCHPCNGGELFGMTGVKAQAAGCWPIYFPTMALSETVKFGTKSNPDDLADDLIRVLTRPRKPELAKFHFVNWKESTDRLVEILGL